MKQIAYILLFFFVAEGASYSQTSLSHGLILAGGSGSLVGVKPSSALENSYESGLWFEQKYRFGMALGYKIRIPNKAKFFYDIDFFVGFKSFKYRYSDLEDYKLLNYANSGGEKSYFSFSVNPSYNYKIVKGLHAGIGLEPTLYMIEMPREWKFDIPLTARVGYDFRYFDLAFSYKYGLFNTMPKKIFRSGRFSNWQVQLFIRF